jgi:hypothetical protein
VLVPNVAILVVRGDFLEFGKVFVPFYTVVFVVDLKVKGLERGRI